MSDELRVLIIGAGTKGALGPVSHAEAFSKHPSFKLVGFVDIDPWKLVPARERWGGECFSNLRDAFSNLKKLDVVVVATPDDSHAETLVQLVGMPVPFIFAEKPFTNKSQTAWRLLKDFKAHNQRVMVNYSRRFVAGFMALREDISEWGNLLGGSAFYGKSLHNLCHWVDTFKMIGVDPNKVSFIDIPRSNLNVFEAFLYFEAGRLDILDFGAEWRLTPSCNREDYPKDRVVGCNFATTHECDLDSAMATAVQNIADYFSDGTPLLQDSMDAFRVLQTCERLMR